MPFRVGDSPRYGKAEAIASKSLAEAFGFQSVRDFRMRIEKERSDGAVILSHNPAERLWLTKTLEVNTLKATGPAHRAPDAITGKE